MNDPTAAGTATTANGVLAVVHPTRVDDVVEVRHVLPGRVRLSLRRRDQACVDAVAATLRAAGGRVETATTVGSRSVLVLYDPRRLNLHALLQAPLPPLELPPSRVDTSVVLPLGPAEAWAALVSGNGPAWDAPAMVRVHQRADDPPAWTIDVVLGAWTFAHDLRVHQASPPHVLELSLVGKVTGVIRYDLTAQTPGARDCHLRQRLWFRFGGEAAERVLAEPLLEAFAQRYSHRGAQSLVAWFQTRRRMS